MPASSQGIRIATVAAGPCAVHCMAIDMDGRLYSWGRNEVRVHGGDRGQAGCVVVGLCDQFCVVINRNGCLHSWGRSEVRVRGREGGHS